MIVFDNDDNHRIEIILQDMTNDELAYDVVVDGYSLVEDPDKIFSMKDSPGLIALFKMMEVLYAL